MKEKIIALFPYAIVLAADFYLLPLWMTNTGVAMLMLLCVIPLIAFICSIIYGVRQGFDLSIPITTIILFAPTIFIYYNESAWIYAVIYGIIALVGTGIGRIFYRKR